MDKHLKSAGRGDFKTNIDKQDNAIEWISL